MARFDVYAGKKGGLFVDVRSDHVQHLPALVLVPLLPRSAAPQPIQGLNPTLVLNGGAYQLMTQLIASVPGKGFGRVVGTLDPCWEDITRALDILLIGF